MVWDTKTSAGKVLAINFAFLSLVNQTTSLKVAEDIEQYRCTSNVLHWASVMQYGETDRYLKCPMTPSHYLNQCCFFITEVQWHLQRVSKLLFCNVIFYDSCHISQSPGSLWIHIFETFWPKLQPAGAPGCSPLCRNISLPGLILASAGQYWHS